MLLLENNQLKKLHSRVAWHHQSLTVFHSMRPQASSTRKTVDYLLSNSWEMYQTFQKWWGGGR